MLKSLDDIQYLYKGDIELKDMPNLKKLQPFSEEVRLFLAELSKVILSDKEAKEYPDVITFAFFCRKANIDRERLKYENHIEDSLGRGLTFHIAPSNVPIIFAYSMVVGLLAGNACIVRVSTKSFPQFDIICRSIQKVFDQDRFIQLKDYIAVIRYPINQIITSDLSFLCDVRIIWGGDNSISDIRNAKLQPRAFDITFADRYSICIINSEKILQESNMQRLAQDFYNDTFLYDQNACSSPHLIIWYGNKDSVEKAKDKFWDAVHGYTSIRYPVEPVIAIDKFMSVCECAINISSARLEHRLDNLIVRVSVDELVQSLPDFKSAGGFFIEYDCRNLSNLNELNNIVTRKYQTLSYFGFDGGELLKWVISSGLSGIDRIVPIGKTSDFSLIWDGYDLIYSLSRKITIDMDGIK